MERLLTFNVCISNGNIKYLIGKSIFAVNLPFKLFRAVVANADIGLVLSLSIHSLKNVCTTCQPGHASEFEQNRMVQTTRNFELFEKEKTPFWKTFL